MEINGADIQILYTSMTAENKLVVYLKIPPNEQFKVEYQEINEILRIEVTKEEQMEKGNML